MPKSHKFCAVFASIVVVFCFVVVSAFATQDVRVVGTVPVKNVAGQIMATQIYGQVEGTTDVFHVALDPVTHAILNVDYPHHEIHEGNAYFSSSYTVLSAAASVSFLITTPNTNRRAHLTFDFFSDAELVVEIIENSVISSSGTAVSMVNHRRDSANTPGTIIYRGATVSGGTSLLQNRTGSGNKVGGGATQRNELILGPSANIVFKATNVSVQSSYVTYSFDWYEHADAE